MNESELGIKEAIRLYFVTVVFLRGATRLPQAGESVNLVVFPRKPKYKSLQFQRLALAFPIEITKHIPSSNSDPKRQLMDVLSLFSTTH